VLIPATANLATLDLVIQALYGWDGDHLHAFRVRRATYSDPSFSLEETRDEYAMRVLAALNAGGGKITYEYDFGASWIHEIALQKKVPREPGAEYPFCVKYSGDSPIEYPVRPRQPGARLRPLALGDSELVAQHQDLGVLPPRLPAR